MRRHIFLLICVVVTATMMANPVSKNEALQKARQFMPSRLFKEGKSMVRSKGTTTKRDPFYIFNDENGRGFVIVSGDDRTEAILGYADNGAISEDNMPDNLRGWLEGYAEQILSLDNDESDSETITPTRSQKPAIAPLITTKWNQNTPYNLMTPTYVNDQGVETHYVTGCVATAIAQVMNYYQWPQNCPAIPAYTTSTLKIFRPELPATTFKWHLMKGSYKNDDISDSADAIAELMAYVGQAVSMDYNKDGSSSYVMLDVMADLFSYSRNAYKVSRGDYSVVQWEDLIYNELACSRPVLYRGSSESSGHQFVCDGYDGEGLFHINWGWGGGSDGFFVLSLANPSEKGIGGGSGTGGYAYGQVAVIGFQPASEDELELLFFKSYTENMPEATYSRSTTNADFENVSTEGCYLRISYYSFTPTTTCDIEAGWAVCIDDKMENVAAYKQIHIDNRDLEPGWGRYYDGPKFISFGAGLSDGNYKLVPVYRYLGDSDWTIISTMECIYAQIMGNTLSVRGFKPDVTYTVNSVDYRGEMAEKSKVDVIINISNTSDVMQETAYFWMKRSSDWKKMGQGIGCVEPGQTGNINLSFTPNTPGTYDVKITSDDTGEKVMGTSTVTIYAVKETTYNNLVFSCNLGTKEAKLIRGDYSSYGWESLEIPATVSLDGTFYRVTRIDKDAFWNVNSLKKVIMPEGLLFIGNQAFQYCYGLREIHLPSTLKAIGDYAFANCNDLNTVVSFMSEPCPVNMNVFVCEWYSGDDESWHKEFTSATLYVPIGTKPNYESAAGWNEFSKIYQGELKETTIEGITYFYATGENIASIVRSDAEIFRDKDVMIPSSIEIDGKSYEVKSIANSAFEDCLMKSLTIEPGIEEIGRNAFWNAYQLEKAVLPEGLLSIGEQAFRYCSGLKEIHLPSTLKAIGDYAFANCNDLNTVVSYMSEPCAINRNVFTVWKWYDNDTSVEEFTSATLYVPIGTKPNYESAAVWNEFSKIYQGELKGITIEGITYFYATGEDVASIVRSDAEILREKDVMIPSSIEIDGKPYEVKSIGISAFEGCPMKSLTIESGIEEIGQNAFWNAYRLEKAVLPEGLLSIGEQAFRYCSGLKEIHLPSTLEEIDVNAFSNCYDLNTVVSYMSEPCAINRNVFTVWKWYDDDTSVEEFTSATLYVPIGTKPNYESAIVWNEFTKIYQGELKETTIEGITYSYATGEDVASIVRSDAEILRNKDVGIPSSIEIGGMSYMVKSIANSAFKGCPMKSLTLESGIEEIGRAAFWNAYQLKIVVLPEGLLSIGEQAFQYCYGLQEVHLPSTLVEIGDYAFGTCIDLNAVVSFMSKPCPVNRNVFVCEWYSGDDESWHKEFTSATLSVPLGKKEEYQAAEVWKEFSTITEFDTSGIHTVMMDKKDSRIFDTFGRHLNSLQKGINIIKMSNGTTKKVLVK